jgi:CheY-like chemotaxis protein
MSEILEGANVTIIECGCGKEAISLFKQHCADLVLVLLDINLPRCNGWDLAKQFRKIKPGVPIIAVSAIAPYELATKCREAGFDAYISKPFDIDEFLKMVKGYL